MKSWFVAEATRKGLTVPEGGEDTERRAHLVSSGATGTSGGGVMASEMVDRVVKAVDHERARQCDAGDPYAEDTTAIARAAIAAMREPTEDMTSEGSQRAFEGAGYPSDWMGCEMDDAWRAMIDKALEEK